MSDHSCATPSNHSGMVVFPPWLNFTVFRGAKSQRKTVAEFLPLVSWIAREHKNESIAPLSHRGSSRATVISDVMAEKGHGQ